jgi:hypothetical protein
MYTPLPVPFAFAGLGAIAGLIAGGFSQCFPVWVGTATGVGVGCVCSVIICLKDERANALPVAQVVSPEPVVIQNIYITYDLSGKGKTVDVPYLAQKN